ncbi:YegS/Rv2252/BmrU family lipid kinase [Ornithinibacillus sp. L9]|uniref:YegS/Rv2252/BmrU family lipid kinase n=1 Tax=Ornithinibacillus caprae TaxID=2678566 RepID=A0A6N8FB52_9BACI|nr:diacylglycerol kinase family protein [Ornithinibacillus caprae]MUK86793.1 YegS/Rv2252/BmrU family lipid kinase [Ornithinibacillus caprae]
MYIFIVNLMAGHGRGRRIFNKIQNSKLYQELQSSYYVTEYEGHAENIAQQLSKQNLVNLQAIIVIGGDGTLHEVMNGIQDLSLPVAFIPGGSGNDFARGLSIKVNPVEILQDIVKGNYSKAYWLGSYSVDDSARRVFVNSIGFGFDAEIAKKANQSWYKKFLNIFHIGMISYVIALIHVLFRFKPFTLELEVNGEAQTIHNCWMVTIANHAYYGGGMKIIPSATIQPSRFPVLVVQQISKWKILALFMTVFTGKHTSFKEVDLLEATKIKITTDKTIEFQVDGQTSQCKSCTITKDIPPIQILGASS